MQLEVTGESQHSELPGLISSYISLQHQSQAAFHTAVFTPPPPKKKKHMAGFTGALPSSPAWGWWKAEESQCPMRAGRQHPTS